MRRFVVIGHRAITSKDFKLKDLCGSTGRLDVLLRCVNSAFFLSHDIRRDVELYLILLGDPDPPKTIRMVGGELKYLNPDERSTGALVRNALFKKPGIEEVMSTPGIHISKKGFGEVIRDLNKISDIVYLRENGAPFQPPSETSDFTFVLGDDRDLSPEEEAVIQDCKAHIISLGPKSYHSDHCITIANSLLDNIFGTS
ncbi:MAG: tRNA (pseudouridine(54)-N(1))-methyltransferase TrmY [Thermoplasmata archaeon]|nr:MAG: tRNA (pseudouridine(54)-N(1))-methyltransferase TrmY [Thermoplasmata archaeon]